MFFGSRPYDTQTGYYMTVAAAENYGKGVVIEDLSASGEFEDLIGGTRLGRSGYAYAVDRAGVPVAVPSQDQEIMRKLGVGSLKSLTHLPQVRKALESGSGVGSSTGRKFPQREGLERVGHGPASTGGRYSSSSRRRCVRGRSGHSVAHQLLIGAFVARRVALSILVARRFVRPIKRLQVAARGSAQEPTTSASSWSLVAEWPFAALPRSRCHISEYAPRVDAARGVVIEQSLPEARATGRSRRTGR